jgi:aminopeptidase N
MKFAPFADLLYGELMLDHETAHQWWGDNVSWGSYRDEWIDEALSNYCSLMRLETDRPQSAQFILNHYRDELLHENKEGRRTSDAGPVTLGIRLISSKFPTGYDDIAYGRGTWLFHMLRQMLTDPRHPSSDDSFWRVLRGLQQRFSGRTMSSRDVQAAFESELPRDLWFEHRRSLDWFFEGWVNGTAVPRLELTGVKFLMRGKSAVVTGRIQQDDAPRDLVTPVPIYGMQGKSLIFLGRVFADGRETQFRLTTPPAVRKLVLDPYQAILRQLK